MSVSSSRELIARVAGAAISAGPRVPVTRAAAVVARLRKAVRWSDSRLAEVCVLPPDLATEVVSLVRRTPVEILDRKGAWKVAVHAVGAMGHRSGLELRASALVGAAMLGRDVVTRLTGIWDEERGTRVLVAPNVLDEVRRLALDEKDWCRWVCLRTSLGALHHLLAPHLHDHLTHLLRTLPDSGEELARFLLLSDAVARASMDSLTTADMPSLRWIRSHESFRVDPAHVALVRALTRGGADVPAAVADVGSFAHEVVAGGEVAALFSRPEALPSVAEYGDHAAWARRAR
ncbi:zinc-dependent metalloprotease [Schaalia sp. 19OD2882]|uniref:zinc-dependent metalloprotease n=1 Tax=Schaalia sp. 19OD2882 TaxID=2794089 RepID=UPI001C1EC414|nr:zinc-dependent metalloprotease [Schaalia sp. 19OD2882]QWW19857.1 zinc-dependent metalloprotease [Schaalia sp. 19OD2882]